MNRFTKEEQLFLHHIHCLITGKPAGSPPEVSWQQLHQLATIHHIAPLFESLISKDLAPPSVAVEFLRDIRRQRMRAALMIENFETIHVALTTAGIPVMALKGLALALSVYPSASLRYFDDLDLLVPAEAGSAALEVLREIGYTTHPRAPKPEWHHLPPYVHQEHHTAVEIHIDLIRRIHPGWAVSQIWERAKKIKVGGVETWIMSNADALVYTGLHARHNLFSRISYFLDAALLARELPEDEDSWRRVSCLADEAKGRYALARTLATAKRLFGLDDLRTLHARPTGRQLASQIVGWKNLCPPSAALRQAPLANLVELLLMDSVGDSWRMAKRLLVPPPEFILRQYEDRGKIGAYGRRLWVRSGRAAKQMLKLLKVR